MKRKIPFIAAACILAILSCNTVAHSQMQYPKEKDPTINQTGVVDGSLWRWNATSKKLEPIPGATSDASGNMTFPGSVSMAATRVEKTADAVLTADECRGTTITNQGAAEEVDLTLFAMTNGARVVIIVEEAQIIEVGPPTGEAFDLDGTTLDANDCIDSPAVVGSKMICTRMKNAAGTLIWSCDTVRGAWTDTGASD
ncbi:MAG: hypothetical protein C4576_11355 [Desulfobacteraceae bacterium]|nr:MAG: hypothetical protein C4576_11355 [Desulfobacteraceae bacterium]